MSKVIDRSSRGEQTDRRPIGGTFTRWGAAACAAVVLGVSGCKSPPGAMSSLAAINSSAATDPQVTTSPHTTASVSSSVITPDLSATITKAMATARTPGAIVGIWRCGAQEVRGFGIADKKTKQPMQPDMFVRIGSNTKSFTLTALLRLVDKGLVKLDDPIARYVSGVPNGKGITLRQLGEMRSGLPDLVDEAFIRELYKHPTRQWTPRELLRYSFSHPALFKPGTFFNYSNTNTILIGLAIEQVTGRPLRDVVRTEVIEPAGLKHTTFPDTNKMPSPHPRGYTQTLDIRTLTPTGSVTDATYWNTPSWGWAAGAIISTAEDMHQWVTTVASGRLLSKQSHAQQLKFVQMPENPRGVGYGLGLINLRGWIGHNGDTQGFSSVMYYYPARDLTLIVVTNTETKIQRRGMNVAPAAVIAEDISDKISPDHPYRFPKLPEPPGQ